MGREVRMVPKGFEHPKDDRGDYIPLFDGGYEECASDWDEECAEWNSGVYPDYASEDNKKLTFEEWHGSRPSQGDYMPAFEDGAATHYMMYEDTSEGTPISPAFETPEELAKWLVDNNASSFAGRTASYEQWLRVATGGFACSAILTGGNLISGVEA